VDTFVTKTRKSDKRVVIKEIQDFESDSLLHNFIQPTRITVYTIR